LLTLVYRYGRELCESLIKDKYENRVREVKDVRRISYVDVIMANRSEKDQLTRCGWMRISKCRSKNENFVNMAVFHKLSTFRFSPCGLNCTPLLDFRPCSLTSIPVLENG